MGKIKKGILTHVAKRVDKWLIEKSRLYRKHFGLACLKALDIEKLYLEPYAPLKRSTFLNAQF